MRTRAARRSSPTVTPRRSLDPRRHRACFEAGGLDAQTKLPRRAVERGGADACTWMSGHELVDLNQEALAVVSDARRGRTPRGEGRLRSLGFVYATEPEPVQGTLTPRPSAALSTEPGPPPENNRIKRAKPQAAAPPQTAGPRPGPGKLRPPQLCLDIDQSWKSQFPVLRQRLPRRLSKNTSNCSLSGDKLVS